MLGKVNLSVPTDDAVLYHPKGGFVRAWKWCLTASDKLDFCVQKVSACLRLVIHSTPFIMEDLTAIDTYLRKGEYPCGMSKGEKANLRRRCRNNFRDKRQDFTKSAVGSTGRTCGFVTTVTTSCIYAKTLLVNSVAAIFVTGLYT